MFGASTMTAIERDRLLEMIRNPKPGSKVAAAKQFGIDLTLNVERLCLSPTERLQKAEEFGAFLAEVRRAARESKQ